MGSRSSLRLQIASLQKKGITTIVIGKGYFNEIGSKQSTPQPYKTPRTVEFLSNQSVAGEERHKLPFMMALGLIPRADRVHRHGPVVRIERLDPTVLAKAIARFKKVTKAKKAEEITKPDNSSDTKVSLLSCRTGPVVHIERLDPAVLAKANAKVKKVTKAKKAEEPTEPDNSLGHTKASPLPCRTAVLSLVANHNAVNVELVDLVSASKDGYLRDDKEFAVNPYTIDGTFCITRAQRKRNLFDESRHYRKFCAPPRRRRRKETML